MEANASGERLEALLSRERAAGTAARVPSDEGDAGPPSLRRQAPVELLRREGRLAGEEAVGLELDERLANVELAHAQLPGDLLVEDRSALRADVPVGIGPDEKSTSG